MLNQREISWQITKVLLSNVCKSVLTAMLMWDKKNTGLNMCMICHELSDTHGWRSSRECFGPIIFIYLLLLKLTYFSKPSLELPAPTNQPVLQLTATFAILPQWAAKKSDKNWRKIYPLQEGHEQFKYSANQPQRQNLYMIYKTAYTGLNFGDISQKINFPNKMHVGLRQISCLCHRDLKIGIKSPQWPSLYTTYEATYSY